MSNCIQWNGKTLSASTACLTSMLTFKTQRWQWFSLLTGCHGNPFRHKDHFCVWVVLACSAPQAALVRCGKLCLRFPGWLNITLPDPLDHSFGLSYQQQREKNTTPLLRFQKKLSQCFKMLFLQMKTYRPLQTMTFGKSHFWALK